MRCSAGLTDKQWQVIEKKLNDKERKQKHSLRFTVLSFKIVRNKSCSYIKTLFLHIKMIELLFSVFLFIVHY